MEKSTMTKRLRAKKEARTTARSNQTLSAAMKKEYLLTVLMAVLLLGSTIRQPMKADSGSVGQGIFGGAATGALVGGLAGGGRGAGYGALAGAAFGGIMGAAADSESRGNDPYRQLDREERKLRKLQDKFDRASDRKRPSLERQVATQTARVQDLKNRLGIRMPS